MVPPPWGLPNLTLRCEILKIIKKSLGEELQTPKKPLTSPLEKNPKSAPDDIV